jgi:hypothetical protein
MNFEFRGNVYNVRWQYGQWVENKETEKFVLVKGTENWTFCMIKDETGKVTSYKVVLYHGDIPNKDKSRKYSLAKVIKALGMTKSERIAIWEQYRTSKPGGRWKAPVAPTEG